MVRLQDWDAKTPGGRTFSRRQLPLQLAWAISIHKSQGKRRVFGLGLGLLPVSSY